MDLDFLPFLDLFGDLLLCRLMAGDADPDLDRRDLCDPFNLFLLRLGVGERDLWFLSNFLAGDLDSERLFLTGDGESLRPLSRDLDLCL